MISHDTFSFSYSNFNFSYSDFLISRSDFPISLSDFWISHIDHWDSIGDFLLNPLLSCLACHNGKLPEDNFENQGALIKWSLFPCIFCTPNWLCWMPLYTYEHGLVLKIFVKLVASSSKFYKNGTVWSVCFYICMSTALITSTSCTSNWSAI